MAALMLASAALAAARTGTYKGKTYQHFAFSLTLSHRSPAGTRSRSLWVNVRSKLRYQCDTSKGPQPAVQRYATDVQIKVRRDGGFTIPLVAGTHSGRLSGTFKGAHVSGTIKDSFTNISGDNCRSGLVGFRAFRAS